MASTRRVKSMAEGKAHYHLISRACNRQFLFRKARTKDKLIELVSKATEFSGIDLEATALHVACVGPGNDPGANAFTVAANAARRKAPHGAANMV